MKLLVLQGPNLDRLGTREPELYGTTTLEDLERTLDAEAEALGVELWHVQSNREGVLIDTVHQAADAGIAGAVVNAAAYTHTSIALRDALLAVGLPFVEVHMSNVHAREEFRRHSVLADVAVGVVTGFGSQSYVLGMRGLLRHLR